MARTVRPPGRMKRFVPFWAIQFVIGGVLIAVVSVVAITAIANATRIPGQFLDDVGRTVHGILPKEGPDVSSDAQVKAVVRAMPDGRLRVGSVIAEDDVVVFTVTARRSSVKAAVVPGDQIRINRDSGEIEIAPQGIPGVIDRLQEELRKLKERFFGP